MACLPSTCPFCSCGCALLLREDDGRLTASFPSTSPPSRTGLCIRGWCCTSPVSAADRLAVPLVRGTSGLVPATWQDAIAEAAARLAAARFPPLFALGPTLSTEDAVAVRQLAERVGGRPSSTDLSGAATARWAMAQVKPGARGLFEPEAISGADVLWAIGFDAADSPQVARRLVEARRRGAAVVRFDVHRDAADGSRTITLPPDRFGELGLVLIRHGALTREDDGQTASAPDWVSVDTARHLVARFREAERPVVIVGRRWLTANGADANTAALLDALERLGALERVVFAVGESNSWGVLDAIGPDWPVAEIACRDEGLDTLVVAADDLVRRSPRPHSMARALCRLSSVIAIDRFPTETTALADVVLPSCTFAEADGWVTNLFGEARPWRRIVAPPGIAQPERIWMERIGEAFATAAGGAFEAPGAHACSTSEASTLTTSTGPGIPGTAVFPFYLTLSSHPASFSTGVMSGRDELLRREAIEPVLAASPAVLDKAGLKTGWAARLVVPEGEVTVTVRADRRLADSVLVLTPLPGTPAAALGGWYPAEGGRMVGLQPVPARLERV